MKDNTLKAWAQSLRIDQDYGLGVEKIHTSTDVNQDEIDSLTEMDKKFISRILGEPVWEIDNKLWTLKSLIKNGYDLDDEYEVAYDEISSELGIEPYMPWELDYVERLLWKFRKNCILSIIDHHYIEEESKHYKNNINN